jgi:hypothetical protein
LLADSEHQLLPLLSQPKARRIEGFTYGLCCSDLLAVEADARRYRYAIQTGKIVLRELLLTQNNTDDIPERHLRVFKVIASLCDDPKAAICELLDLRNSLRAAVLQNPKARQLLRIIDPHPLKVFDDIDRNAHQVLFDRLQKLRDRGFTFPGPDEPFGAAPIEFVDDAPVGRPTIERLFELAEAAVMCRGLTSWATGVLLFLSQFVPHDDHLKRARALRDRIQMAVKFDPDPEIAATYRTVAKVTDDAIAELES